VKKVVGVESFSIVIRALCKLKTGKADALSLYHKMSDLNLQADQRILAPLL
jgi:pentatricopeptide repeat protein